MRLAGCSWSGGKDSCYALMVAKQQGFVPMVLVNMMNENGVRSRSHGLPASLLNQQALAMGLPLIASPTSWANYESTFIGTLHSIRSEYGIEAMVFGDIDLQPHRDWEEKVCAAAKLEAVLPIWQRERRALVMEMLAAGIETMIVSCNDTMGEAFLGRTLTADLVSELEALGVDPCGENGEFHTLVVACPLFATRVSLPAWTKVKHEGYWFLEWVHK